MNSNAMLAILIPTRNRSAYLKELLSVLLPQTVGHMIKVYIRDNASEDDTECVVKAYQEVYPDLVYYKNEINVGGDVNFMLLVHGCKEEYFWLFGDDEVLLDGSLHRLMDLLTTLSPDYIVLEKESREYQNFSEYIECKMQNSPFDLIASTLITANIIRRSVFDLTFATTKYTTHYGHMYGIAKPLSEGNKKIVTLENSFFKDRGGARANPVDGDWSKCLEKEWNVYLRYLSIIAKTPYPFLKIFIINSKRHIRYKFGAIVTLLIGNRLKIFVKKHILK